MNNLDVARTLLETRTVFFAFDKPYISYCKYNLPIYIDNRLLLSYPKVRKKITACLVKKIKEKYPDVEMIIGIAIAGVAFAMMISEAMHLPMGYVLSAEKDHGMRNRVEGVLRSNTKVVVVDDVVCTGSSLVDVVECLREHSCDILGAVSIFSYEIRDTTDRLIRKNIPYYPLTEYSTLIKLAYDYGKIRTADNEKAKAFLADPSKLNKNHNCNI